jgi:hypothetical protein
MVTRERTMLPRCAHGRSGGFALFPSRFDPVRRVRHERGIVMGAERNGIE